MAWDILPSSGLKPSPPSPQLLPIQEIPISSLYLKKV